MRFLISWVKNRRHDIQHNGNHHNESQHDNIKNATLSMNDSQQKQDSESSVVLSAMFLLIWRVSLGCMLLC